MNRLSNASVDYLAGTPDKGLLITPDPTQSLYCFVDADFADLWNIGDSQDPISVMLRIGFVLFYSGCPLLWLSKLQTKVALSTTEAEYIALSQSLCDVIPLLGLLAEHQGFSLLLLNRHSFHASFLKTIQGLLPWVLITRLVLELNILV